MNRKKCRNWNRREFGKASLLGALASSFSFKARGAELKIPLPGAQAQVILTGLAKGASDRALSDAVREAALAATDFSWLSRGDSILIKPVCNSNQIYPATTNPAGLTAMIRLLKDKGAGKVIVMDMGGVQRVKLSPDGLRGSTRQLMKENGLLAAAEAGGAELYFPEEEGWEAFFEDGPVSGSHWKKGIMVPKKLKESDHLVLMPRVARHMILGTTLGLKAVVGYMRFDARLEYHRDAATIYEKTAEANTIAALKDKLRLVVTTATKVITTLGPDSGYVAEPETGLIIASPNLVAHDMTALAWFMIARELTPDSEKRVYHDPYLSTNSAFNHGVVLVLGGVMEAAKTEAMKSYDFKTIWQEPTLNRAFQIFGGAPKVSLLDAGGKIPEPLKKELASRISPA